MHPTQCIYIFIRFLFLVVCHVSGFVHHGHNLLQGDRIQWHTEPNLITKFVSIHSESLIRENRYN